ncbi:ABC transporter permease [Clostridium magnum]|uniref:Putative aliphatic sulfonates transport permease protein SsuC n=1 Tax=Clostridium magnum DSM 2767 TaxID=1121326 RepID=A0A162T121_9CLOT|nr:ABC transporter permease [Clostridium magnum]KZL92110.1 putative aliphatic sulfonates transport permease protein SsuC [Clostridium magnum DSM 2767]SHH21997.1 sulfonate transport system permease protein [Clostridium magnum DSM 2767]
MKKLKGLVIPILIIIIWWIGSALHIFNDYIIPSPLSILSAAYTLLKGGVLIKHISVSFCRVLVGFLITFAIAFPLAVLAGMNKKLMLYLEPFLEFNRHIPPIAVIPILILWFGIGEVSKLAVIFLATFFPVFSSTLTGVTNYDEKLLEVGAVFNFSNKDKFFKIILPQAIPSIITGIQLGLGYSWRSLMGAELVAASSGIGYMIMDAEQLSRPDIIIVGIFSIGILGYAIDYIFLSLTNKFMHYHGKEVEYGRAYNKESVQDF